MPPPISDDESLDFGQGFFGAAAGLFRLTDMPIPAGRSDRWQFRLLENRDTSNLQDQAVSTIVAVSAIIIDGTSVNPGGVDERGSSLRTVSVFAQDVDHCPLISIGRRDDQNCESWSSLAGEALADCAAVLDEREVDVAGVPLISLEPELATERERRRLLLASVPYAMRVNGHDRFCPVWEPEDPLDLLNEDSAETLFARHRGGADPKKPTFIRIKDLQSCHSGGSGVLEEHLFRFPAEEAPEYFLAHGAQRSAVPPAELMRGAEQLARQASTYAAATPGERLRLHEFHHSHAEPYCQAVRVVDRALYLDPDLGKDPVMA
ncbi:MAG TPA: hypothetical protein VFY75_03775 [Solirubrobacterales bacterium]|nr:hypothetical protein [Solirubrobacterales bacterium]